MADKKKAFLVYWVDDVDGDLSSSDYVVCMTEETRDREMKRQTDAFKKMVLEHDEREWEPSSIEEGARFEEVDVLE